MDFGKSFTFITEDTDWLKKIGITALLLLTGIGGIGALGWVIEIVKRVANDEAEPLPGWEDIGDYFISGLKLIGVVLIWSLPIIFLSLCSTLFFIPLSGGGSSYGYEETNVFFVLVMICFSLLVILYSLVVGLLSAPVFGMVGEDMSFTEMLNPKKAFALLKGNVVGYLIAFFVGTIIYSILSSIGVIACFIGSFFGAAFGYAVMGHLVGQAHAEAKANLELVVEEAE